MREHQRERRRALVDLAALDADAPVLDHVDAAPAVRADDRAELVDERDEVGRVAVERRPGTPRSNADDDLARLGGRVASDCGSSCTAPPAPTPTGSRARRTRSRGPTCSRRSNTASPWSPRSGCPTWRRGRCSRRGSGPTPAPARARRGRGRGCATTPRTAPGRCPCRCSRGRPRRRRAGAPTRTRCSTITGRDSADTSGYLPSYIAFACSAGTRTSPRELRAGVDHLDLDRAGGARPARGSTSSSPGFSWPTSTAHAIDLVAPLLADPPHGDGRVEPARIRQHNSLRHDLLPLRVRRARRAVGRDLAATHRLRCTTTSTVSSPATVPSVSGIDDRSIADATTCALPGGVRSTTRLPLNDTSTTNSPSSRFR